MSFVDVGISSKETFNRRGKTTAIDQYIIPPLSLNSIGRLPNNQLILGEPKHRALEIDPDLGEGNRSVQTENVIMETVGRRPTDYKA